MRRSPITVGVLAAELAIGALVLAPPAAADDDPAPTEPPVDVPLPDPLPIPEVPVPTVVVRTGRAGDPNAVTPTQGDEDADDAPPASSTPPSAPDPEQAPAPANPAPAPSTSGTEDPATPSVPSAPTPTPSAPAPAAGAPPLHTVVEGDNLWSIAAAHLARVTGRDVAAIPVAEVALYWVRVCDTNAPTLASGDLDVIYAGEQIALPPV